MILIVFRENKDKEKESLNLKLIDQLLETSI